MRHRQLGRTGLKISVLGLGFWQAGSRLWGWSEKDSEGYMKVRKIVEKAFDAGINFFDTAEIYGAGRSESMLGKAVEELGLRDDVVIVSKIAGFRYRYGDMKEAVKRINKRLGSEPDIILHHWPPPIYVPLCRVINNLEKLVEEGFTHYYGLSNYADKLLEKALYCVRKHEPVMVQLHYNIAYRTIENHTVETIKWHGLQLVAWSPLAKGALAGLRRPVTMAQRTDKVFRAAAGDEQLQDTLRRIAEKYGVTKSAVALAWIIAKNAVPIPGTRKPDRVLEYALAGNISLSSKDIEELDKVSEKYVVLWGKKYSSLRYIRLVPGILQSITIGLMRGI